MWKRKAIKRCKIDTKPLQKDANVPQSYRHKMTRKSCTNICTKRPQRKNANSIINFAVLFIFCGIFAAVTQWDLLHVCVRLDSFLSKSIHSCRIFRDIIPYLNIYHYFWGSIIARNRQFNNLLWTALHSDLNWALTALLGMLTPTPV